MAAEPQYLLDSNIGIYLLKGASQPAADRVQKCEIGSIVTSSIAYGEMLVRASGTERLILDKLLHLIEVRPFDALAATVYGTLPFRRRSFDRLIAAHALALDLTVITANIRDFDDVPGLRVEDWTAE